MTRFITFIVLEFYVVLFVSKKKNTKVCLNVDLGCLATLGGWLLCTARSLACHSLG